MWLPLIEGLTPHGLRHSHKTWMLEDAVPEVLQAERLGHTVPGILVSPVPLRRVMILGGVLVTSFGWEGDDLPETSQLITQALPLMCGRASGVRVGDTRFEPVTSSVQSNSEPSILADPSRTWSLSPAQISRLRRLASMGANRGKPRGATMVRFPRTYRDSPRMFSQVKSTADAGRGPVKPIWRCSGGPLATTRPGGTRPSATPARSATNSSPSWWLKPHNNRCPHFRGKLSPSVIGYAARVATTL